MKRFLLISLSIFTGLSAFAMIKDSAKELNNALELVIKKLPLQLDDPIKEMADTEEEEAFELLIKSKLGADQQAALSQAVGVYTQITYDFPLAYPNYDNVKAEMIQKTLEKYGNRIDKLNGLLYKDIEWI
jgi:hypothetical protein